MDNIYKPGPDREPKSSLTEWRDPTKLILNAIGRGLIIAFFFPIFVVVGGSLKLVFLNIQALGASQTGGLLKIQVLYPLLAGIAVLVLVKQKQSQRRAAIFLGIALFPVLVLFLSEEVRTAFSTMGKDLTGGFTLGLHMVVSALAIFAMLAGGHTVRIEPKHRTAGSLAVIGGLLFFLSLLIPVQDKFVFLQPFQYLTLNDPSGVGIFLVTGLASLLSLALMIFAALTCFQIQNKTESKDKEKLGRRIIKLWVWHLLAAGTAVFYMIFIYIVTGKPMGGGLLLMLLSGLIKIVPWILGLYLLVPLAISEFLLTHPSLSGTRDTQKQIDGQEQLYNYKEEPPQVPDEIVFGDQ